MEYVCWIYYENDWTRLACPVGWTEDESNLATEPVSEEQSEDVESREDAVPDLSDSEE